MRMGSGIRPIAAGDPNFRVTPETVDALYHTSAVKGNAQGTQGPAEFQNDQGMLAQDFAAFS